MNVIIIRRHGISDTPILVKDNTTAQAVFDEIAEELAGEDITEISLHFDSQLNDLNDLIKHKGIEVEWFEDLEVNEYIN